MMRRRVLPGLIGALVLAAAASADEQPQRGLEFSGSMYADLAGYHYLRGSKKDSAAFAGTAVLATIFRNVNRAHAKVEGDFELTLPYGAAADSAGLAASRSYELMSAGTSPLLLDIRKLFLEFYLPFADVALGRQIINFGEGQVFSPIDAFSSVQITDINLRRNGSDVANVQIPFGTLAGVDCIVEAPFDSNEHSSAAKFFATIADWDLNLVGVYRHKSGEVLVGTAFKGDAVVGLYGELVGHFIHGIDNQYTECMLGSDYSIRNTWFFNVEYYYKDHPANQQSIWGRNNAYASVQFAPNELMRFSVIGIGRFEDHRAIGMMSWYYSLLQNAGLTVYVRGLNTLESIGALDLEYAMRVEVLY